MTTNIATTREQSARLLQCGVDPDTADMSWVRGAANVSDGNLSLHPYRRMQRINWQSMRGRSEIAPAWSLSALLGLLPKKIMNGVSRIYTVEIAYSHTFNDAPWTINYEGNGLNKNAHFNGKSPIEACVKAIEWLTANNYKLNQL
ncbi:hypothetical protein [uncultured Muribaculum sp.]|uniref:hypothetical protein n=1 Tax=uncultured Muribaculum sp. TaxID=1918613 RepID=UPI0025A9DC85|nr:hypothetical protein [uncultured Muribaculum sp.]